MRPLQWAAHDCRNLAMAIPRSWMFQNKCVPESWRDQAVSPVAAVEGEKSMDDGVHRVQIVSANCPWLLSFSSSWPSARRNANWWKWYLVGASWTASCATQVAGSEAGGPVVSPAGDSQQSGAQVEVAEANSGAVSRGSRVSAGRKKFLQRQKCDAERPLNLRKMTPASSQDESKRFFQQPLKPLR